MPNAYGYIAYGVSPIPSASAIAATLKYASWIYVTDEDGEPSSTPGYPYNVLPSYLAARCEVDPVSQVPIP